MMRRMILAGIATLFVAATSASAQDPRLAQKLDPQTLAAVEAVIDSARAAGIPTEPIVDRALESVMKKRSPAEIIAAVRRRAGHLAIAKAALAPASDGEILAGADALAWGVPDATLVQLRQVRSGPELTIPISVLADLVARGVQVDTASAVVIALASTAMRDTDMLKFRQTVERDIALGSLPSAATQTRAESAAGDLMNAGAQAPSNGTPRAPNVPSPKPPIKP
jgi:hypothetical protein